MAHDSMQTIYNGMSTQPVVMSWRDTECLLVGYANTDATSFNINGHRLEGTNSDEAHPPHVQDQLKKRRKRQYHTKTRSGCLTCKARKVKCGEERPTCKKCQIADRVCEGYEVPQVQISDLLDTSAPRSLNLLGENEEAVQALQFFREKTTPILSNFSAYAAEFWSYVVPRVAVSEETVRALVIAVGAQQKQNYETARVSKELARSPARYYGRALRRLSDPADPPETVIILICCLLFICMENIKGTHEGIYSHINAGLRVLREWKANKPRQQTTSSADLIVNYIEPFMGRLEAAAAMVGAIRANTPEEVVALQWKKFTVPSFFPNFLAARESWFELCQWLFRQCQSYTWFFDKELPAYQDMIALWKRWRSVLRTYEQATEGNRSLAEDWQLRLLQCHYRIHFTFLEVHAEGGEMGWDTHIDSFRKMMNTCARFLEHKAEVTKTSTATGFGFNPGIVPPLYSIATVCRDGEIRHKCIELLKNHHNTWHNDDCSVTKMAEALATLEEQGSGLGKDYRCSDITPNQRVRLLGADFSTGGKITLLYTKSPFTRTETYEVAYRSYTPPPVPAVRLFPLSETVRLAGYQGLIRRVSNCCICKSYGG